MPQQDFSKLYAEANAAGFAAVEQATIQPMVVDCGGRLYHVPDGVCGFAQVSVSGTSPFGKWARANLPNAHKGYPSGVAISIWDYNQSMQKKEVHARAMAEFLNARGIVARAHSQID